METKHDDPVPPPPIGYPAIERALLGRILSGHQGAMVPLPNLKPHRFSQTRHQTIYTAIYSQARRKAPYDLATVANWLRNASHLNLAGGTPYLASLLDEAGPVASVEGYASLITEAAARRACARIGKNLEALAADDPGQRTSESLVSRFAVIRRRVEAVMAYRPDKGGLKSEQAGDVYRRASVGPPWLMAPWIAEQDFVICVGEQGLGKSWVALQVGVCLATGHSMLDDIQRQPRRVLYVDAENNPALVTYRLRRLANGLGLDEDTIDRIPLWYADVSKYGLALDTDEGVAALDEECRMRQPEIVILDSLMDFQDLDENSNTEMKRWLNRTLRPFASKHRVALVALHHMSKPAPKGEARNGMHRGRGASAITGIADQVWSLGRENEQLVLRHEKCRWGLEAGPIQLSLEDVNDGSGCRLGVEDFEASLYMAMIDVLKSLDGPIARRPLIKAMAGLMGDDINPRTFSRLVARLLREKKITRTKDGKEALFVWNWHR